MTPLPNKNCLYLQTWYYFLYIFLERLLKSLPEIGFYFIHTLDKISIYPFKLHDMGNANGSDIVADCQREKKRGGA